MSTKKDINNIKTNSPLLTKEKLLFERFGFNLQKDELEKYNKSFKKKLSLENDIKNEKSPKRIENKKNTNEKKSNINSKKFIYQKDYSSEKVQKKNLFGFTNIGHSCYMNSFLQILLNTPHFLEILKQSSKESSNHPLIDDLIKLSETPKIRLLKEIKRIMAEEDESFGKDVQNDSQEFGIKLINKIIMILKGNVFFSEEENYDDEEINLIKNQNYKKNKFNQYITKYYKKENEILLEKMFQFHEIIYNIDINEKEVGKYKKIDFNSFINIDLVFPNNNDLFTFFNSYKLYDLLKDKYPKTPNFNIDNNGNKTYLGKIWTKFINFLLQIMYLYKLPEQNYLDSTSNKKKNICYNNLCSLPNILIISINRAFHGRFVNKSRLIFEEILDLKDFLDPDFSPNNNSTYKLYGVNLCYRGFFDFGHCYSFVKIKDIWYKFDDNNKVIDFKETPEFDSKYIVGLYYIKECPNSGESF